MRSTRQLLVRPLGLVLAIALLTGAVGVVGTLTGLRSLDTMNDVLGPLQDANDGVLRAMGDAESGERGFLITGDERFLEPYYEGLATKDELQREALDLAGGRYPEIVEMLEEQGELADAWHLEFADEVIELRREDPLEAQVAVAGGEGRERFAEFRAAHEEVREAIEAEHAAARSRVEVASAVTLLAVAGLSVAAVAAVVRAGRRLDRTVARPLDSLETTVRELERGDLGARADCPSEAPAEVVALAGQINAMASETERLTIRQRRRIGQGRLLADFAQLVRTDLDPANVISRASREIGLALDADRAFIRSSDSGQSGAALGAWQAAGVASLPADATPPVELIELVTACFASDEAVVINDATTDDRLGTASRAWFEDFDARSVLLCPVRSGDEMAAVLSAHRVGRPRAWTEEELVLADSLARELGVALRQARLYENEKQMVSRLRELDEAKSDFVSSVSHELRTPLASIVGYAEMLRDGDAGVLSPAQDGMLDVIERNTNRLLALIDDLLTLSRIESVGIRIDPAPLDPGELVTTAAETIRSASTERDVTIRVHSPQRLAAMELDGPQIERAVMNLVSNAVKFTPDGGAVDISLADHPDHLELRVSDTGVGIPADELDQIFNRFYRSSTARDLAVQGTGLGLVIVKEIVEAHGGTVEMRSELGRGTTVTVLLPRTGGDTAAE